MLHPSSSRTLRGILYGAASVLLLFDVFFLIRATLQGNFVPIVPVLAGMLAAGGLVLILFAEQRSRIEDKKRHLRLASVAHQLESPLASLREDLDVLLKYSEKLPSQQRLQVKRMQTKSGVLLENIRDVFLTLQALEGSVANETRLYDLCKLISEAKERTHTLASARNVEIITNTHCKTAPIKIDKRLFMIALQHLIENAVYYTRTPGIVNIALTKGKNRTRIIVQDRGIGIEKEDRNSVFEPFARGHEAHKYDPDGIGLGLSLARLILKEFDGTLMYRPRKTGSGSQFEISLPLAKK